MSFMSGKHKKQPEEWRKRNNPNAPNYGQAFQVEPHGNKQDLPKALRQVSFSEIPEFIEKRRRKGMTPEQVAEDELIENAIDEQIAEEKELEKKKNLLVQLGEALDREQKKRKLKKSLEDAKAEAGLHEGEDGYDDYQTRLEELKQKNDANEVFG